MLLRNEIWIPDQLLSGIERHLRDVILLHHWTLEPVHQDFHQQLDKSLLFFSLYLLLPLLLFRSFWCGGILLGLSFLLSLYCLLHLLLQGCQRRVLRDIEVADLGAQDLEHIKRQWLEVLEQGIPSVQVGNVGQAEDFQARMVWEFSVADSLQQLQLLVVKVCHLPARQRFARCVINLKVLVIPEDAQQLVDEPCSWQLSHL
mmetsp:Transcript_66781/g.118198  ORF Transcript_66781/g.118198 Transcript_66781/m.118198 type:complete len:202 (+) Transcript_66781:3174-3779(+)